MQGWAKQIRHISVAYKLLQVLIMKLYNLPGYQNHHLCQSYKTCIKQMICPEMYLICLHTFHCHTQFVFVFNKLALTSSIFELILHPWKRLECTGTCMCVKTLKHTLSLTYAHVKTLGIHKHMHVCESTETYTFTDMYESTIIYTCNCTCKNTFIHVCNK